MAMRLDIDGAPKRYEALLVLGGRRGVRRKLG
jgi:hypothetical protein